MNPSALRSDNTSSGHVLVVDDDPQIVETSRTILEAAGYRVRTAANEQEALARLKEESPDLLLLDVMMSSWDSGFRLLWDLKSNDAFADVPVVLLTAVDKMTDTDFASHANSGQEADQQYLPVAGYIVKPVRPAELTRIVASVLKDRLKKDRPR